MTDLFATSAPRPAAVIDKYATPAIKRIKGNARRVELMWISWIVATTIQVVCTGLTQTGPTYALEDDIVMSCVVLFYMGLLPVIAIRRFMRGDAKFVKPLLREGTIHHITHLQVKAKPGYAIRVGWEDDGSQTAWIGLFEKLQPSQKRDIAVLVRPGDKHVGFLLGDNGLYVGLRRLRR